MSVPIEEMGNEIGQPLGEAQIAHMGGRILRVVEGAYEAAAGGQEADPTEAEDSYEPEEGDEAEVPEADDEVPEVLKGKYLSNDPVKDYLKEIGKHPLINAAQEVDLSKRIEAGLFAQQKLKGATKAMDAKLRKELEWIVEDGRNAKNTMLEANLRLVVSLAKRYTGRGMLFIDLIQEGNLGLIRAVEKFDYVKGYKFSTYATWWIRQAITRAMADQARTIRIPVHMVEVMNKLARIQRQMLQDLGREPTPDELALELDMTIEKVIEVQKYGREPISLDEPVDKSGAARGQTDTLFGDLIEDREAIDPAAATVRSQMSEEIRKTLEMLDGREQGVIMRRFGMLTGTPETLDEIGKVYGVTRERIRQVEAKALAKLRQPSMSGRLEAFSSDD